MARKRTDYIVVHCADTYPDMDIGAREINRWHLERGWLKIGYHLVIRRDGTVENGRGLNQVGAHAQGYNDRSIGICLVGGKSRTDDGPEDNFTEDQMLSLKENIESLLELYPDVKVIGHNEISSKACPCFDVDAWWAVHSLFPSKNWVAPLM